MVTGSKEEEEECQFIVVFLCLSLLHVSTLTRDPQGTLVDCLLSYIKGNEQELPEDDVLVLKHVGVTDKGTVE
jgi:hypothetical protein